MNNTQLLALVDPQGNVVHTKIGLVATEIIEEWLAEESSINFIGNLGRASRGESRRCLPSWEAYEAEGYTIQPVKITICQQP
jgi:hypothetical protein